MRTRHKIAGMLLIIVILASCKSISSIPIPKGSDTAVVAVGKKVPLNENLKKSWNHADLVQDSIPGLSTQKAYDFLNGKKGNEVIVAIVDSGTDLNHEDLKEVAWVNAKEIPDNGKDDDGNGFIDDIHGWNFLGKIYKENAELYRIIKNPKIADEATYKKAKKVYDKNIAEAETSKQRYEQILQAVNYANENIVNKINKKEFKKEDLKSIDTSDPIMGRSVAIANQMFELGIPTLQEAIDELTELIGNAKNLLNGDAIKKEYRAILNDDANSMTTKIYGDSNSGPSEEDEAHGSHVSGIVAATRDNGVGINGIAKNVKIMAIRVVPDGDEYDKDVALGIRYAVDNGAKVINTSFGKGYSPKAEWVYEAIKYAAEKDVLIVNAAGNESQNIDEVVSYPNDTPDGVNEIADNFITIGAISSNYNENLPAVFTNYGKKNVDVFAPGVEIYSTVPGNKYEYFGGTSMASPAVAGVAALIRSYYPKLTASQVKRIIMNSGSKLNLDVIKPGSPSQENPNGVKVPFADLSVTGRIVNTYNALKMANKIVKGK